MILKLKLSIKNCILQKCGPKLIHFSGKQGKEDKLRLGDFWRLQLIRPSRKDVLRRCKLMIRQCNFSGTGCSISEPLILASNNPKYLVYCSSTLFCSENQNNRPISLTMPHAKTKNVEFLSHKDVIFWVN